MLVESGAAVRAAHDKKSAAAPLQRSRGAMRPKPKPSAKSPLHASAANAGEGKSRGERPSTRLRVAIQLAGMTGASGHRLRRLAPHKKPAGPEQSASQQSSATGSGMPREPGRVPRAPIALMPRVNARSRAVTRVGAGLEELHDFARDKRV